MTLYRMDGSEVHVGEKAFGKKDLAVVTDLLGTYLFPKTVYRVHRDLHKMGYKQSIQITVLMLHALESDERVRCYRSKLLYYYPQKLYRVKRAG